MSANPIRKEAKMRSQFARRSDPEIIDSGAIQIHYLSRDSGTLTAKADPLALGWLKTSHGYGVGCPALNLYAAAPVFMEAVFLVREKIWREWDSWNPAAREVFDAGPPPHPGNPAPWERVAYHPKPREDQL